MGLPSVGGGAPAHLPPPSASDVAPLKRRISQDLQQGKTLAQAVQDARSQSANDAALAEAAILAQEEYALARQASAKPPAKPADPLPDATAQVRQTHAFSNDALNAAAQALAKPAAPAADASAGKPAAPPDSTQIGQDMQAIATYRQSGMSWQQAINAARIDQGGNPADETTLAEAALALEGPQHLDALADGGDPIAAARQSLDGLHVFAAPVLDAAAHAMTAPDTKAAPKPAAAVRTAQTQLDRDRAAHAAPNVIARDESALHTALADALQAAYPDGPPHWSTDPTRADWLWHAQWQVLKDVLGPDAPNLTPAQLKQRTQDLSVSMAAAIVLRDVRDTQGGTANASGTQTLAAVRRLDADLQGLDSNDPVYREVMGDGAITALEDAATRDIAGPAACVANQDARAYLAAIASRLGAYRGTSLYDTLVQRVLADPAVTELFTASRRRPNCRSPKHTPSSRKSPISSTRPARRPNWPPRCTSRNSPAAATARACCTGSRTTPATIIRKAITPTSRASIAISAATTAPPAARCGKPSPTGLPAATRSRKAPAAGAATTRMREG